MQDMILFLLPITKKTKETIYVLYSIVSVFHGPKYCCFWEAVCPVLFYFFGTSLPLKMKHWSLKETIPYLCFYAPASFIKIWNFIRNTLLQPLHTTYLEEVKTLWQCTFAAIICPTWGHIHRKNSQYHINMSAKEKTVN